MAAKQNFKIQANGTFTRTIEVKSNDVPLNLTGYTFEMEVKAAKGPAETAFLTLTIGSGITVDAVNGLITFEIAQQTSITATTVYYYDLIAITGGKPYVWLYGTLTFEPGTSYTGS